MARHSGIRREGGREVHRLATSSSSPFPGGQGERQREPHIARQGGEDRRGGRTEGAILPSPGDLPESPPPFPKGPSARFRA